MATHKVAQQLPECSEILADLARVKAIFQLRTIALVIGTPPTLKQTGAPA